MQCQTDCRIDLRVWHPFELCRGCPQVREPPEVPNEPTVPQIDEMLMTEPPPARFMAAWTALVPRKTPVELTAMTWFQLSNERLGRSMWVLSPLAASTPLPMPANIAERIDPAVLRFNRVDQCDPLTFLGDIEVPVIPLAAGSNDLAGHSCAKLILEIAEHHASAVAREYARGSLTYA
jgi:hypothetical protein